MAIVFLEPADFSAVQALQILTVLNDATDPRQLAQRIEIAGEPDIGERLAQRLLEARARLPGGFSRLEQVLAVPQIGPERFSDLCTAIIGIDLRRQWHAGPATPATGGGAIAGPALEARAQRQPAWLGQPVWLRLTARDADGRPLVNRLLTLSTDSGVLELGHALGARRGRVLQARSGTDGSLRVLLLPAAAEALAVGPQAALESALDGLPAAATAPLDLASALQGLVAGYQQAAARALRQALDHYSAAARTSLDAAGREAPLQAHWPLVSAVVRADLHAGAGSASVAQACLPVHWQDWTLAWLHYMERDLLQRLDFSGRFGAARLRSDAGHLVGDLLSESTAAFAALDGQASRWLGGRLLEQATTAFLATETTELDLGTREQLYASLPGTGTRVALAISAPPALTPLAPAPTAPLAPTREFELQTATLEAQLAEMRALEQRITLQSESITAAETRIGRQAGEVADQHQQFRSEYDAFQQDNARFDTRYRSFQTESAQLQTDLRRIETDVSDLKRNRPTPR